ncbi:MAG: hypothetical protein OS130_01085 [Thermodesulfobacteriota bacterium]|nr:MAG: hypothetical protein OS130_01085 [Thermodesulfobacteriota bacterium]
MTKLIPYKKAKSQALKLLKAKDVKEAENVLALCTDETRLRIYGEMTPHELGLLASRGDMSWIICELPREMLINALAHDPELIDEKGQLYPVQAVAVAYSLTDREDAPNLYQEEDLIRNIVSMAFLVEVPEEFDFEEADEVENWLLNHWLNRFEPDIDDLLKYDEETLFGITADIREKAKEEIRIIQKAMKARAEKVEREMFDI